MPSFLMLSSMLVCVAVAAFAEINVTQIHLSLTGDDSVMGLEYVSAYSDAFPIVEYKSLSKPLSKSEAISQLEFRQNIGFL